MGSCELGSETPGSIKGEEFLDQLTYHLQYFQSSSAHDNQSSNYAAVKQLLLSLYVLKSSLPSVRCVIYFTGTFIYLARDSGSVDTTTITITLLPHYELQQNIILPPQFQTPVILPTKLLFVPTLTN